MDVPYAKRIYTYAGVAKESIFRNGEKVLHVGSGGKPLPGALTVDKLPLPGVAVVHDLDQVPWPFPASTFDLVFAHNVLEHLDDQVAVMEEIWRILKPGGRVVITVPYFRCTDAFTDATHKHFFTTASLDYYIAGKKLSDYRYTTKRFTQVGFWFGWPQVPRNPLTRLFKACIARYPRFYDSHLSLLFPVKVLIWELAVIKDTTP